MSDEENVSVEAEASEAVTQATETESAPQQRTESPEDRRKRNDQEYNWAEARRKLQDLERRAKEQDDLIERLKQPKSEDDEIDKLAEDDIVTKGHTKKLVAKMAREIANEVIQQREAATVEDRLAVKFNDYSDVVTRENIELLKQNEPELAMSLAHNPDPYAQGIAAYKLIKKMSAQPEPKSAEKKKALENSQKPVSVNAVTRQSAIGNAHMFENGLTPELKASLLKEMREAAKGA